MSDKKYIIDAKKFETRYQAHEYMKEIFCGLEYYGNNLDSLHDVLTSIGTETVIIVKDIEISRERIGCYADRIAEVIRDSAAENKLLRVEFTAE